jgi:hypothetical protein
VGDEFATIVCVPYGRDQTGFISIFCISSLFSALMTTAIVTKGGWVYNLFSETIAVLFVKCWRLRET